ncbi:MAG: hypothetical protein ACLQM8_01820 [Limisphaerales bacterium]
MKTSSILALALVSMAAGAQQTSGPRAQNRLPLLENVHLVVSISNHVVKAGSSFSLSVQIKNSSTNAIDVPQLYWREAGLPDLDAELVSATGKTYRLTPEPLPCRTATFPPMTLRAGETRLWRMPATINKDAEPGDYLITAEQRCRITQGGSLSPVFTHVVVSKPVKIRVE